MKILNIDIEHHSIYPWQFMRGKNCYLRLRTTELVRMVTVVYGDPYWFSETGEKTPVLSRCILSPAYKIFNEQFYSIMIPMHTHKLRYYFIIELMNGEQVYLSEEGVTQSVSEQQLRPFFVSYVYESDYNIAPIWAQNFVWYQIFPDRFKNDNGNVKSENFIPTRENFYGGTLKGIKDSIPYLKELGVQGVYLNPIFLSDSNHRYDTRDYSLIDSGLGDEMAFRELVNALHKADMRIMLDGVFNHCSWNHPFWQDVRTKGKDPDILIGFMYMIQK